MKLPKMNDFGKKNRYCLFRRAAGAPSQDGLNLTFSSTGDPAYGSLKAISEVPLDPNWFHQYRRCALELPGRQVLGTTEFQQCGGEAMSG